jgi:hypothetical protein
VALNQLQEDLLEAEFEAQLAQAQLMLVRQQRDALLGSQGLSHQE